MLKNRVASKLRRVMGIRASSTVSIEESQWMDMARSCPPPTDLSNRWWIVDGDVYNVDELRRIKKDDPNPPGMKSRRKLRFERAQQISRLRLAETGNQEYYWKHYMETYENVRNAWEELIWDPPKRTEKPTIEESFFDPIITKKKRREDRRRIISSGDRKPFSIEEIQAAMREGPIEGSVEARKGYQHPKASYDGLQAHDTCIMDSRWKPAPTYCKSYDENEDF